MGISTHVLDVALGKPAAGVPVRLAWQRDSEWTQLGRSSTDADGRCRDLLGSSTVETGSYRLIFDTGAYFDACGVVGLYPEVTITFWVRDPGQHHHIPLLLAPNGYSTYRGS